MKNRMLRKNLLLVPVIVGTLTACTGTPAPSASQGFDPSGLSVQELSEKLEAGEVTSVELVDFYLNRIEELDFKGPGLNSVISVNGNARAQAQRIDDARDDGTDRGALHGIPFVVKDNYDVVGLPTTAGSAALANNYPTTNSIVVQELLNEGAIVLAKTNMSEFAASYGRLGYSSLGGQTRNPFNLKRDASGSSSGSAVAVSAGLAPFALGTDTSGSVRAPASVTGIVGIRPTHGLASGSGVVPLAPSFDTPGPMARTVTDAAIVLDSITTPDAELTGTSGSDVPSYSFALDKTVLEGARIGVLTEVFGGNAEVDQTVRAAISSMEEQGATAVPVGLAADYLSLWGDVLGPVGEAEFAIELEAYLAETTPGIVKTLEDVIAISASEGVLESATPVNPARLEGLKTEQANRGLRNSPEYQEAVSAKMPQLRKHLEDMMDEQDLDGLVFPTMACVATPRYDIEDPTYSCDADDPYTASYIGSATGLPEITVPAGADQHGMPIGISFLGRAYDEQTILNLGYAWEAIGPTKPAPGTLTP